MSFLAATPVSMRQKPVFKTPMSFSPHITGEQARPSPSRFELWREELGLEDDNASSSEDSTNSDEEPEVDQYTNKLGSCSLVEYQALQKELEERNKQRDDLLYRLKTLTDKNKNYKNRLEREEANKKQQLKIMRRTHEALQQEKDMLIKTLEEIIEEQEEKISQVECQLKGDSSTEVTLEPSKFENLLQQVTRLQDEKADLINQNLQYETELRVLQEKNDAENLRLREANKKLEEENSNLQEEVIKLRCIKTIGSTDAEKMVCTLEIDNDKLRREVRGLKQQVIQVESDTDTANDKKFSKENEQLKQKIEALEMTLSEKSHDHDMTEEQLRNEIKRLTTANQSCSREVRELGAKLTALQAKSPEVVHRVKKVEVESTAVKEALQQSEVENSKLSEQINVLKVALEKETQLKQQLEEKSNNLQEQLTMLKGDKEQFQKKFQAVTFKLESVEQENSELQQVSAQKVELQNSMKELQSKYESTAQQLTDATLLVDSLKEQIQTYKDEMQSLEHELREEITVLEKKKEAEAEALKLEAENKLAFLSSSQANIRQKLSVIYPQMAALTRQYKSLRKLTLQMPQIITQSIKEATKQLIKSVEDINKHSQELVHKYRKEMMLRKKYHNELVDLKGNIRVFGRVRPLIKEDGTGPQAEVVVQCDPEDDGILSVMYKGRLQTFDLDRVFDSDVSQSAVFDEVQALVTSVIDGYNVCIFAYGQTGSGKTFTMEGTKADPGINQRALAMLFQETAERSTEWTWTISVSVMEIYNEMLRDLLSHDPSSKLEIKMGGERGLYVPGLTEIAVSNVQDVNEIFNLGHENRQTATTNMNEHSSRSHAILTVNLVGQSKTTGTKSLGKLNLVDLAGSERVSKSGADGTRLKEAQNINRSLSSLGDVIHALRGKQSHIPYRNSKLTYLLQDSLGGNSKTLMIVQISPVEKNVGESCATLNFAQRVRSVELGQANKKIESTEASELKGKLASLEDHINHNNHIMNSKIPSSSKLPMSASSKSTRRK